MSDAMQVAQQRKNEYTKAIAKKEEEIAELKEMIADLDSFMEFGKELLGNQPEKAKVVSRPVVSKPAPQVAPASDPDDEWGADDPKQSIARVLAQRTG